MIASVAGVQYRVAYGYLFCMLPSGRCLAYANPRLRSQVYASRLIDGVSRQSVEEVADQDRAAGLRRRARDAGECDAGRDAQQRPEQQAGQRHHDDKSVGKRRGNLAVGFRRKGRSDQMR